MNNNLSIGGVRIPDSKLEKSMETQERGIADPQTTEKILAIGMAFDEGEINSDPAAIAALFTEDAVMVTRGGPVNGRQAVEKWYTDRFQGWHSKNHIIKFDGNAAHLIGTTGNQLWATGEWSDTGRGNTGDPRTIKGYWAAIYNREGDVWKIRLQMWNITPAPVAK